MSNFSFQDSKPAIKIPTVISNFQFFSKKDTKPLVAKKESIKHKDNQDLVPVLAKPVMKVLSTPQNYQSKFRVSELKQGIKKIAKQYRVPNIIPESNYSVFNLGEQASDAKTLSYKVSPEMSKEFISKDFIAI